MSKSICFRNIGQLVQVDASSLPGVRKRDDCALLVRGGRIDQVVRDSEIKPSNRYARVVDLKGRAVIPGLVDCHTHLIFAGERKDEMEQRTSGMTYMEILENGGGIHNTVRQTRKATEKSLFAAAKKRMHVSWPNGPFRLKRAGFQRYCTRRFRRKVTT